jgi:hypothetical protein
MTDSLRATPTSYFVFHGNFSSTTHCFQENRVVHNINILCMVNDIYIYIYIYTVSMV